MRIVVAGASGFMGSRLLPVLQSAGHEVLSLVRRDPGKGEARWDPDNGSLDISVLEGAGAVINLCGAGAGDKRWTDAYRALILSSRVKPTELLARACVSAGVPRLLNASAIGIYGHRGDEVLTEASPADTNFFAEVCLRWEAATAVADVSATRVVHLRSGLVLGAEGGLLPRLSLVTKLFAGGRLGTGRQYYSWISATDQIDAIVYLMNSTLSGPVNLTAPEPVTNAEFTKALGRALHRPTPWIVPEFAIRAVVGEFAGEIVTGQRVVPAALQSAGFVFTHATLADALRAEMR